MDVAVKMIEKDITASSERSDRFLREVMMLSRVEHDNLVKFIGAEVEPELVIVTELMRGDSLQNYLRNMRPCRPELRQIISFALDVSQGMECIHSNGIIHRDLKPANHFLFKLLLTEDCMKLKLAGIGMAREKEAGEMMTCEASTYKWMAPESYSKEPLERGRKKHYDQKVDVYSFSLVFWELLTNSTRRECPACRQHLR
ncbi:serine/threonine-protein kinase STY8-like [Papaver somniferum]|uniref:serine/threonine-protein kinase STY8-like n=1 Tax=Papaver somniferum TaxID=3469 RepID=UPI000E6FA65B|nr:serine/threonine-protein kinase STY8-like [Papaver somniferum]